jgi:hypothetical protein
MPRMCNDCFDGEALNACVRESRSSNFLREVRHNEAAADGRHRHDLGALPVEGTQPQRIVLI